MVCCAEVVQNIVARLEVLERVFVFVDLEQINQCNLPLGGHPAAIFVFCFVGGWGVREVFHWIPGEILCIWVVSKPLFMDSDPELGFGVRKGRQVRETCTFLTYLWCFGT